MPLRPTRPRRFVRRLLPLFAVLAILPLAACGSMRPRDFEGAQPRLQLEDYFQGKTKAYGLFHDRFGDLRRQFVVEIDGDWNAETRTLTLDERFRYADGEDDRRVWRIRKTGPHSYVGSAGDVIGQAEGSAYGNAFNWTYDVRLNVDDTALVVHFDDWLFLQEDGVLLNTATVTKWGLEIGRVTLAFHRLE